VRRAAAAALGLALAAPAPARGGAPDADAPPPLAIVQGAFDRMFNYPSVRSVSLRIHRGGGRVAERAFDVAYRREGERGRSLLRFTAPDYLRGHALLVIEEPDGQSDVWLYQPEARRPRRVSAARKADAFYGSDLAYEDLEHHDFRRWTLARLPDAQVGGRACFAIEARPPPESQYGALRAWVERERLALLRVEFFRPGASAPSKTLEIAPGEVRERNGVLEPERMWVRQVGRSAATEVVFSRIRSGAEIDAGVFAAPRLERSGEDLFGLVERLRAEPAP
jgi:hypothetical protein